MNFNTKIQSSKLSLKRCSKLQIEKKVKSVNQNIFILKLIQENFIDFCNGTNLHGFRQITENIDELQNSNLRKSLYMFKNITWTIIILFGFVFGIYLLTIVFTRYQKTPTITTVESNNYGIWNIPFPAVTICNINSVYEPYTANTTKILLSKKISMDKIKEFYSNLSALIVFEEVDPDLLAINDILASTGYDSVTLMKEFAQPCENLLKTCKWIGKIVECSKIFRLTRSDLGYCCSFNYKALRSLLAGAVNDADKSQMLSPVIHIAGAGEDVGLHVTLNLEQDSYVSPRKPFYGAEVIIHDSLDYPDKTLVAGIVQPNNELTIGIEASVVVTDDSIMSFPVDSRFCLFDNERRMWLSDKYSYQSCITECRIETLIKICKCLPFYYPFINYNNINISKIQPCGLHHLKCLSDNKPIFASLKPPKSLYLGVNATTGGMECNCLPSCKENHYGFETYKINRSDGIRKTIISQEYYNKLAILKVQFKELSCIKYRREIFMTWDNLLASFGGIFGLCLGGSVLSVIEIIYYATFKFIIKYLSTELKLQKEKEKENSKSFLINYNKNEYYQQPKYIVLESRKCQQFY